MKVLNTSELDVDRMLENKEFYTIFSLMGLGIGIHNVTSECRTREEALEVVKNKAQYGKLIICSDEDSDGSQIRAGILYCIAKFARFMIDLGLVFFAQGPLYKQDGKFYFQSDMVPGETLPRGVDPRRPMLRFKGVGSVPISDIRACYFAKDTRRLVQVTPQDVEYAMSLTEDIKVRKKLLTDFGILSNPFGFTDI